MSYYVADPDHRRNRTWRAVLIGLAAAAVLVVLAAVLVIGRADAGPAAAPAEPVEQTLTWASVGTHPVPVSTLHGPRVTDAGVARGFSHDELGAAIAAIHISVRLSATAGAGVYEVVAREQCLGDVEAAIATIRGSRSTSPAGSAVPEAYYFKITAGDAGGDQVLVSLAVANAQGRDQGGFVGVTRTLRWVDQDWKIQLPLPGPQLLGTVDSYTPLGGPRV